MNRAESAQWFALSLQSDALDQLFADPILTLYGLDDFARFSGVQVSL